MWKFFPGAGMKIWKRRIGLYFRKSAKFWVLRFYIFTIKNVRLKISWKIFLRCRNFLKKFLEIFYISQTFFEKFSKFWKKFCELEIFLKFFFDLEKFFEIFSIKNFFSGKIWSAPSVQGNLIARKIGHDRLIISKSDRNICLKNISRCHNHLAGNN